MNKEEISKEFQKIEESYNLLGKNVVEALKMFLDDSSISFLEIYYRVKKIDSFLEKIERKGYKEPLVDIEDICGVRIVCYYTSDIERINKIINDEFNVHEQQNKSDLLGLNEFAYRSNHYIVSINESWLSSPNYRKSEGLKIEIQVRTVLMHAWAEIEHKLNYKSDSQVPDKFKRKLFRLSAKFEEADEQLEELKVGIENYKIHLEEKITTSNQFDIDQDFNIESFRAFIHFYFPEANLEDWRTNYNFENYKKHNKNFKVINNAIKIMKPHVFEIAKDLKDSGYSNDVLEIPTEFLAFSLDVLDDEWFNTRHSYSTDTGWRNTVIKWREKIKANS